MKKNQLKSFGWKRCITAVSSLWEQKREEIDLLILATGVIPVLHSRLISEEDVYFLDITILRISKLLKLFSTHSSLPVRLKDLSKEKPSDFTKKTILLKKPSQKLFLSTGQQEEHSRREKKSD